MPEWVKKILDIIKKPFSSCMGGGQDGNESTESLGPDSDTIDSQDMTQIELSSNATQPDSASTELSNVYSLAASSNASMVPDYSIYNTSYMFTSVSSVSASHENIPGAVPPIAAGVNTAFTQSSNAQPSEGGLLMQQDGVIPADVRAPDGTQGYVAPGIPMQQQPINQPQEMVLLPGGNNLVDATIGAAPPQPPTTIPQTLTVQAPEATTTAQRSGPRV
jgi:hypothetical protein